MASNNGDRAKYIGDFILALYNHKKIRITNKARQEIIELEYNQNIYSYEDNISNRYSVEDIINLYMFDITFDYSIYEIGGNI